MTLPLASLHSDLRRIHTAWEGALPAFGPASRETADPSGSGEVAAGSTRQELAAMSDAGLVELIEALAQGKRSLEAVLSWASAELAERSRPELGADGLSSAQGFSSPQRMIATTTGGSTSDASKLIAVGEATGERMAFSTVRPPKHPHLARVLAAGDITVDAAALIAGMLDRVALRADPEDLDTAEANLAAKAALVSIERLSGFVKQWQAVVDPDGVEPREAELRQQRQLSVFEDRDGMVVVRGRFDPESGAPVKVAIEAIVGTELRREAEQRARGQEGRAADQPGCQADDEVSPAAALVDPAMAETRSMAQRRADALADIARHALGCEQVPTTCSATVVVRIDVEALTSGRGFATIDGIDQAVSVATARCMAADAGIIPAVLGGESEVLDFGREKRLFTRAQKLALAERDGGCAFCGSPPQYAEAHHIDWWVEHHGPTDLRNGVLLCRRDHQRIHRDGWRVEVRDNRAWFIPPPHVDIEQKPRPGGSPVPRARRRSRDSERPAA